MTTNTETQFTKDLSNKRVIVMKKFEAPLAEVWKAWTEPQLLDKWWAPKPWQARTKSIDFREGGGWLYTMVGPEGDETWCCVDYKNVVDKKMFTCDDYFCDKNGIVNNDMPVMNWKTEFSTAENRTILTVEISFASEADLGKVMEMGFEEGFTSALGNLEELLKNS